MLLLLHYQLYQKQDFILLLTFNISYLFFKLFLRLELIHKLMWILWLNIYLMCYFLKKLIIVWVFAINVYLVQSSLIWIQRLEWAPAFGVVSLSLLLLGLVFTYFRRQICIFIFTFYYLHSKFDMYIWIRLIQSFEDILCLIDFLSFLYFDNCPLSSAW